MGEFDYGMHKDQASFDIEGADKYTYFAINAGAKLSYNYEPDLCIRAFTTG